MASSFPSAALRKAVRVLARTMLALLLFMGFGSPALAAAWTTEQLTVPVTPDGTLVTFSEQESSLPYAWRTRSLSTRWWPLCCG